jgi:hypothetical protein
LLSIHSYCSAITEPDAKREVDVACHLIRSFILGSVSSLLSLSLLSPYPFHNFVDLRRSKRSGTVFLELSGTARGGMCFILWP